jgi:hypothetical protein
LSGRQFAAERRSGIPPNVVLSSKLDRATKRVSTKLTEQTTMGAGRQIVVDEVPVHDEK